MDPPESVHSPAVRAHISHAVIASYVRDALEPVTGLRPHGGRAVRVTGAGDTVDLELHVALDPGIAAPAACREAEGAVRGYLGSMVAVEPAQITIVVEDATGADG